MYTVIIRHKVIGNTDYTIYTESEAKELGIKLNPPEKPVKGEYILTDDGYAIPVLNIYETKQHNKARVFNRIVRTPVRSYTIVSGKAMKCIHGEMQVWQKGKNSCRVGGYDLYNLRVTRRRKEFMIMSMRLRSIFKANEAVFGRKSKKKGIINKFNELHKIYEREGDIMARVMKDALESLGYSPDKIAKDIDSLFKNTNSDAVKLAILKDLKKTFENAGNEAVTDSKKEFNGFDSNEVMKLVDKKVG